ncbi:MAG: C39 family peptidase [Thermoplasmata archaeon]|nr:C39 family peptidase [Thermoplasmata archaeon]
MGKFTAWLLCVLLAIPVISFSQNASAAVTIQNVPYIHQVYDTPDWFNGHWACGATSAMMAIAYYGILPHWDCNVSVPYPHVSHWGRYICEIYTYNGYTYNIGSADPSGNTGYGGYGYITQNDWEDTKGHMAEYFVKHGLGSSVDWSPTWAELKAEIDAGHPVVLLTSLTTAGHYVLAVGYYSGQYSVVVNDPYGNKNQGYMNYNGAYVTYDWPGYNYGNANLNTVHCFIYARGTPPSPDSTPPQIQITSPANNTLISSNATIKAQIYENESGLKWARLCIDTMDDASTVAWDSIPPHEFVFDTRNYSDGTHAFYVQAKDNAGNIGVARVDLTIDNAPPEIQHQPLNSWGANEPILIEANVSDANGIGSVVVYYSPDNSTYLAVSLSEVTPGYYRGEIPAQQTGQVYYYLVAYDNAGNMARKPADWAYIVTIEQVPEHINLMPIVLLAVVLFGALFIWLRRE